ncbi:MAG TPA: c-type cytochrome [Terriglobia bacterium]|nr:c-type cytochrome [Terriglobia bacterium]
MTPRVLILAFLIVSGTASTARAQEARIWTGIFSNEQAERGKADFAQSCTRCHGQDLAGLTAPSLNGNRFITAWENENLYKLFVKIRDTMPPNFGTILTDEAKLDVLTFLLRTNGYPAGTQELKVDAETLENIQIVRKGAVQVVSNFSVVRVVGCLAAGSNRSWILTNTTEPVLSRDQASTAEELKTADALPLGKQNFLLVNVAGFDPQQHSGKKVDIKGLLYKDDADTRINVTSLQTVGVCTTK